MRPSVDSPQVVGFIHDFAVRLRRDALSFSLSPARDPCARVGHTLMRARALPQRWMIALPAASLSQEKERGREKEKKTEVQQYNIISYPVKVM